MTTVAPEHVHEHAARPAPTGWRRLLAPGWLRVPWMIALFFGIGAGITVLVRWFEGWHPIWKGSIITTVELTSVPIGFLAGIGAFDYWARYFSGAPTVPEDHSGHGARSWRDYFRVNTDHKVIGVQYLVTTIFFFLAGGLLAMFVRAARRAPAARPGVLQHGRPVGGRVVDHDRAQLPGHDHHDAGAGDDLLAHAATGLGELHDVAPRRDRDAVHRRLAVLRHVRPGD